MPPTCLRKLNLLHNFPSMAVSDASASNSNSEPNQAEGAEPTRQVKRNWPAIRRQYETSTITQRALADQLGISPSTLMKRAMREKWKGTKRLVLQTAAKLEADLTVEAKQMIRDELAPFIEAKKIQITKRGVKVGERGLSRVEKLWRGSKPTDAKEEADAARAADTFLRMARTSLGMNEGSGISGALTLNILSNQAAISVSH